MKIVQILGGFVHWDASASVPNLEAASRLFAADMIFVEAPDYVFEGWGYDPLADGDARFIQPEPPEGWLYDPETGTYYPDGEDPPGANTDSDVWDELAAAYREGVNLA